MLKDTHSPELSPHIGFSLVHLFVCHQWKTHKSILCDSSNILTYKHLKHINMNMNIHISYVWTLKISSLIFIIEIKSSFFLASWIHNIEKPNILFAHLPFFEVLCNERPISCVYLNISGPPCKCDILSTDTFCPRGLEGP